MANTIIVQNTPITVITDAERDYICLTDMAGAKTDSSRAADIIKNWMRARYTIEFLGTWESIHNPDFKVVEFDHFRKQAGMPSFVLSVSEWIDKTNAIGFIVRKGRYGGTYAHKDIAFEFGSAISVPFKLYLIEEFQRLKEEEQKALIEKDSTYGNIICRCASVSEGEILETIRRPLGARTLDGVKRRTGANMGRCQGGFCYPKVMEILSKELGIPIEKITKKGRGSEILTGTIKENIQ